MKKGGLGKGLDCLISKQIPNDVSRETLLRIAEIEPNRDQPRKVFDEKAIFELAESIKEYGVIQPIVVIKKDGYYSIVAGERRWRAAKEAGLKKIPAIIKEYTEKEIKQIALIENLQRENLNPIEEAEGIKNLISKFGYKQEEVSNILSKSRPYISNLLRLLNLCDGVKNLILENKLSNGHGRALAAVKPEEKQLALAQLAIKEGLSVRELEKVISQKKNNKEPKVKKNKEVKLLEKELENVYKTKVEISNSSKNKGFIKIKYSSLDEFEQLIEKLRSNDATDN